METSGSMCHGGVVYIYTEPGGNDNNLIMDYAIC